MSIMQFLNEFDYAVIREQAQILKTIGKLDVNIKRKKNCVIIGKNTIFGVSVQDIVLLIKKESGK